MEPMAGKLQHEIRQTKPFQTLEEEAYLNLERTADVLARMEVKTLKAEGLSGAQYNVLRILRGAGPAGLACGEIAARMVTRDPDITRLLDRLERRGLAQRVRDERDRRVVTVRISGGGLRILKKLDGPVLEAHRRQLGHMKQPELRRLIALLEKARHRNRSEATARVEAKLRSLNPMKPLKHAVLITAVLAALAVSAGAQTSTWQLDPQHSSAQFSARHLLISTVRGEFHNVTGTVYLDEKDIAKSRVEATIDTATIDTREAKRDVHLKSADFLDVANFPTMTFKSTKVEKAGNGKLRVTGDLTIRGVAKSVVLDVEGPTPEIKDPWGNIRRGAMARTKINRFDYGVSWDKKLDTGGLVVGETVEITIDLELIKKA